MKNHRAEPALRTANIHNVPQPRSSRRRYRVFVQDYQQQRIANFIVPDKNATFGATYNVSQALIAIGSGGVFGKGYGHGTQTQLRFLKVRHTDFIFSAISEEFGLVGSILVVIIIVLVIWRCLRAAQKARDVAGMNIAYGVATLIFFQGMVNIGVNLNIVPVSGLPLPFISYGGSGLTSLMLGIGLDPTYGAFAAGAPLVISWIALFPVVLFSMLAEGSVLMPYSPATIRSLKEASEGWVFFYMYAMLIGILGSVFLAMAGIPFIIANSFGCIGLVLTAVLYCRILGRLMWYSSEKLLKLEQLEERRRAAAGMA